MNLREFLEFIKPDQQIEICFLDEKGNYTGDELRGACSEVYAKLPIQQSLKRVDECFLLLKCTYDGHLIIAERM